MLWFWQRWRKRLPSLPLPGLPDNFLFQAQFLPIPPPPSSSQLLSVPHKYLVENNRQLGWPSDRRWATWRGAPTSQNHSSLWQLISCESLEWRSFWWCLLWSLVNIILTHWILLFDSRFVMFSGPFAMIFYGVQIFQETGNQIYSKRAPCKTHSKTLTTFLDQTLFRCECSYGRSGGGNSQSDRGIFSNFSD